MKYPNRTQERLSPLVDSKDDLKRYLLNVSNELLKNNYILKDYIEVSEGAYCVFNKRNDSNNYIYTHGLNFHCTDKIYNQINLKNKKEITTLNLNLIFKFHFEYMLISNHYKSRYAERSKVYYINHINEGLFILDKLNSSDITKGAFCLHPLTQGDPDLFNFYNQDMDLLRNTNVKSLLLTMEYRNIANDYLSNKKINSVKEIRLSTIPEIQEMLIADKIQNFKDLILYNTDHPKYSELYQYFQNWFERLNISKTFLNETINELNIISKFNF